VLIELGDFQEILNFIDHWREKGLTRNKTLGKLYAAVGYIVGAMGGDALVDAVEYYSMASALVKDDWEIWFYQGLANYRIGYYEEALDCLQRAREIKDSQEINELIESCLEEMEEDW
jgi:tetratricopeptide (TPR) repeat protein